MSDWLIDWFSTNRIEGHKPGGRADFLFGDWPEKLINDISLRISVFEVIRPPIQGTVK